MPEPTVTPEPSLPIPGGTPTANEPVKTDKTFTQDEVDRIIRERLDKEKRRREEETAKAKSDAEAAAAAKNQEWEKLARQRETELAETQRKLAERDLADRKRTIAEKAGLPASLASRLVGTTDEELEADAKALLETIPKSKPANPGAANPGITASIAETRAQAKARLTGQPSGDLWGGGGIFWGERPKEN